MIESSKLFTPEQKDLMFANVVIETNPQKYLDMVDAPDTKELFALLSSEQKRSLETRARSDIRRINAKAHQERVAIENQLQRDMSLAIRESTYTKAFHDANRNNMNPTDVARGDKYFTDMAKEQKANAAKFEKIRLQALTR